MLERVLHLTQFMVLAIILSTPVLVLADTSGEIPIGKEKTFTQFLLGQPAQNSIYAGMWSYHFIEDDDSYQTTHNLLGLTYKGIFAGTFENSKSENVWAIGCQRDMYNMTMDAISIDMGYRVGLMYGYDNLQLFNTGIFPLIQLYSDLTYKRLGIQLAWAGSAVTAGFIFCF